MTPTIPLVDLALRGDELDEAVGAVRGVMQRGWFIMGPEVRDFEEELAASIGRKRAIAVASGTDALIIILRSLGIGAGDEVIVPAFTAFPTAVAVLEAGATPVLVDVRGDIPVLDESAALRALSDRTRAVIVVHLYGVVANVGERLTQALARRRVLVIEDCAQAQGARYPAGAAVGSVGDAAAFSFYPTKNLAALGDGGAIVTDDDALAAEALAWRAHGERGTRYLHELPARNSRLDDVQAAVLRLRLRRLEANIGRRRTISDRYAAELPEDARYVAHSSRGAPHLAVMRLPDAGDRDGLIAHLAALGVASGVHYPIALPDQPALRNRSRVTDCEHASAWARTCLSLPIHDHLSDSDVERVIEAVSSWPGWH